jgi:hypothetical protein
MDSGDGSAAMRVCSMLLNHALKNDQDSWVLMAHAYNPSYSGDYDQED